MWDHEVANWTVSSGAPVLSNSAGIGTWGYPTTLGTTSTYGARYGFRANDFAITGQALGASSYQYFKFSNKVYISKSAPADIPEAGDGDLINDQNASGGTDHDETGYSQITNDLGTTSDTSDKSWSSSLHEINCESGQHLLFMVPTRLITATNTLNFIDNSNNQQLDMTKGADDVSVENERGFTEDYTIYHSTETGLGEIGFTTKRVS